MIDEKLSDFKKRVVAIRGDIALPACCILCGSKEFEISQIVVTRTNLIGIESIRSLMPLCAACKIRYPNKRPAKTNILAIVGIAAFVGTMFLSEQLPRNQYKETILGLLTCVSAVLVGIAGYQMFWKKHPFPIECRGVQGPLFSGYSHYKFTFPDDASMERFVKANAATTKHGTANVPLGKPPDY